MRRTKNARDVGHHVVVVGMGLHRARVVGGHVVDHHGRTGGGSDGAHRRVAEAGDVVDHQAPAAMACSAVTALRVSMLTITPAAASSRTTGSTRAISLVGVHRCGTGSGGLAADVDEVRPLRGEQSGRARRRRRHARRAPTVGERVGRDVDDAHHHRGCVASPCPSRVTVHPLGSATTTERADHLELVDTAHVGHRQDALVHLARAEQHLPTHAGKAPGRERWRVPLRSDAVQHVGRAGLDDLPCSFHSSTSSASGCAAAVALVHGTVRGLVAHEHLVAVHRVVGELHADHVGASSRGSNVVVVPSRATSRRSRRSRRRRRRRPRTATRERGAGRRRSRSARPRPARVRGGARGARAHPASTRIVSSNRNSGRSVVSTADFASSSRFSSSPHAVGRDAAAGAVDHAAVGVHHRGADGDVERGVGSYLPVDERPDDADRAAVHAPRPRFDPLDVVHRGHLRRAGDAAAREQRVEQVDQHRWTSISPVHGGRELPHRLVPLQRQQRRHRDRSDARDTADVVAQQVDDHHVLGTVLHRRDSHSAARGRRRARARATVPFIGRLCDRALDVEEQLGTR